jgi:RHS repeat-associated protein
MRDIRGSVVVVTDSTGGLLTQYDYYPFGAQNTLTGSHDRHKYTHKELDDGYDIDLYYYGARYYDSELGRFISADPIRGYYNAYSYAGSNPVMMIDPDGKEPWWLVIAGIGMAWELYKLKGGLDDALENARRGVGYMDMVQTSQGLVVNQGVRPDTNFIGGRTRYGIDGFDPW